MNRPAPLARVLLCVLAAVTLACSSAWAAADASSMPGYVAVPLRRAGNYIVIDAVVNGHAKPLLVDTGSPRTLLSQSAYADAVPPGAEAHLPATIRRSFKVNGGTAAAGWVQDFRAGAMNFGSVPVAVTDLSIVRRMQFAAGGEHHHAEGLLGLDLLLRYGAIIDPARQVIYFNTDPAKRAHLGPLLAQSGWTAIPMELTGGKHLSVPTEIASDAFRLTVDTGAFHTGLSEARLSSRKLDTHSTLFTSQILNLKRVRVRSLILKDWKIGEFTVPSFAVGLEPLPDALLNDRAPGAPTLGLLGADLLLVHHAIIDVGGMKLFLHPY